MPAAIGDAYATAATYRGIADKDSTAEDTEIDADLLAVSRYLTRKLGQFFTKDASAVARLYRGSGTPRLYLTDHEHVPGLSTLTGLIVKVDLNADYDVTDSGETLTIDTHFWAGPADADKGAEARPWRYLDLKPGNSVVGIWPRQERAVEVTAVFGWPAVPKAIELATCHLTALLRLETPRSVTSRSDVGEILGASREAQGIVNELMLSYRSLPTF